MGLPTNNNTRKCCKCPPGQNVNWIKPSQNTPVAINKFQFTNKRYPVSHNTSSNTNICASKEWISLTPQLNPNNLTGMWKEISTGKTLIGKRPYTPKTPKITWKSGRKETICARKTRKRTQRR